MISVVRAGPLTTVQDQGRFGYAHLGVPRSGALDQPAAALANALVGNAASAAVLETTLMGCALRFAAPARVAVTGATAVVRLDGAATTGVVEVPAGSVLDVGRATALRGRCPRCDPGAGGRATADLPGRPPDHRRLPGDRRGRRRDTARAGAAGGYGSVP
jgi:hypothetical protein